MGIALSEGIMKALYSIVNPSVGLIVDDRPHSASSNANDEFGVSKAGTNLLPTGREYV